MGWVISQFFFKRLVFFHQKRSIGPLGVSLKMDPQNPVVLDQSIWLNAAHPELWHLDRENDGKLMWTVNYCISRNPFLLAGTTAGAPRLRDTFGEEGKIHFLWLVYLIRRNWCPRSGDEISPLASNRVNHGIPAHPRIGTIVVFSKPVGFSVFP
jgi:hypothetical protein